MAFAPVRSWLRGHDHRPIKHNKKRNPRIRSGISNLLTCTTLAIALSASSAYAQKKYDPGASDTEIKVGETMPFSGPASAYATIGKAQAAYINMINDQGGINGRKIKLIQYDDAYSPPKAVEQIRKLVESDEVLLTFQILGTPSNARGPEIPQRQEGAATVRRHRRDKIHRPQELSMDYGLQSQPRRGGAHLRPVHPEELSECQDSVCSIRMTIWARTM